MLKIDSDFRKEGQMNWIGKRKQRVRQMYLWGEIGQSAAYIVHDN